MGSIFKDLLKTWGRRTTQAELTRYEKALIHLFYLGPLATVFYIAARVILSSPRSHISEIVSIPLLLAAGTVLFLFWAVFYRKDGLERWALSHLLWISKAYISLAAWCVIGSLFFAVFLIVAGIISAKIAAVLIYAIPLVALAVTAVFIFKIIIGYLSFLRQRPIGRGWQHSQHEFGTSTKIS